METAEHVLRKEPGDDLFDVLCGVVMAGVHQNLSLRPRMTSEKKRHAPVGDIRMVKSGLEGFVFDEQALSRGKIGVSNFQEFLKPALPLADVCRAWIIRAVGKPEGNVASLEASSDLNAVAGVLKRSRADRGIGVAKRAVLILLILKEVRIDGPGLHAVTIGEGPNFRDTMDAVGKIPQHMKSDCRAGSSQEMDLPCIAEFFFRGGCRGSLNEFPETGTCVGKAPRGNLNAKLL